MNRTFTLTFMLVWIINLAWAQGQPYKLSGTQAGTIEVNRSFTETAEITPFPAHINRMTGLAVTAAVTLADDESSEVKIILTDKNFDEYLVFETSYLLASGSFIVEQVCEETCILDNVRAGSLRIEVTNATVELKNLTYTIAVASGLNIARENREKMLARMEDKVNLINKKLRENGKSWVAGPTEVGEMSYSEKKALFGQSTFPAGFEYYAGGVISAGDPAESIQLKSAAASQYTSDWDWRNRHGRNWITPVTNQSTCGSCWAFAAAGTTEAMVNLFFNQMLHLNLSEQELLSCTSGTCSGGYPSTALNYIAANGIVDEKTFPYANSKVGCENKGSTPSELIKIGGKVDFGSGEYTKTDDNLKKMLIHMGPISGGLLDWSHAMVLVGYKVVKEGDKFYYRAPDKSRSWITVGPGDPLIGKTVWIFKNSWGTSFGDQGYVYVETAISNMGWTHAIKPQVTSLVKPYKVVCEDRDGDGYYWWGLGPKPSGCNCPDTPDGDDSDPTRGPIDAYGNFIMLSLPPVADFTAAKTTITEGEMVQFTDLSSQGTTSWSWVFEGGNPSTSVEQNPSVNYSTPGTYKVTLTASNKYGSNTKSADGFITVNRFVPSYCASKGNGSQEWIASVAAGGKTISSGSTGSTGYSNFTGVAGFSAQAGSLFNFTLKPAFKNTAYAQVWRIWIDLNQDCDFDDAGELIYTSEPSGSLITASVKLPVSGGMTTRMRVSMKRSTAASPCETFAYGEVEDYTVVIAPAETTVPVADFTASKTVVKEGESITFTDKSTGGVTAWNWTFEGGTPATSTQQNPVVKYTAAGKYKVALTATNANGSHTKTADGFITVEAVVLPVADFTASKTVVKEGESITFTDMSSGGVTAWNWTFEGGTPATSTQQNPVVKYTTAGKYKVSLTATNANGSHTKTADGYISVEAVVLPVADFTAVNTKVKEGESVSFTDLSTGGVTAWNWTFEGGNPGTSSSPNPVVTYPSAGTYRVSLEVWNKDGSDIKTAENFITAEAIISEPLAAGFTSTGTLVEEGGQVQFYDTSSGNPDGWQWSFPGGTPSSSTEQHPVVTYAVPGTYDVGLTITKTAAGSDEIVVSDYILVVEKAGPEYCKPVSVVSSPDYIRRVEIGNVLSKTSAGDGYSFSPDVVQLIPGQRYNVTLVPAVTATKNFWRLWIDFNRDGDFSDSGETLIVQNNKKGTVVTSMLIPNSASGQTRMRVTMFNGSSPGPCADNFFGEVEDYVVSFDTASSYFLQTSADKTQGQVIFSCYPNPVSEILHIRMSETGRGATFSLYSLNGSVVQSGSILSTETELNLSSLPHGMYLLKVFCANEVFSEKIIRK